MQIEIEKKISPEDSKWLLVEDENNNSECSIIAFINKNLEDESFIDLVKLLLDVFPIFNNIIIEKDKEYFYKKHEINILEHTEIIKNEMFVSKNVLEGILNKVINIPLCRKIPMVKFFLVNNIEGNKSAVIMRWHHCYMDAFSVAHAFTGSSEAAYAAKSMDQRNLFRKAWDFLIATIGVGVLSLPNKDTNTFLKSTKTIKKNTLLVGKFSIESVKELCKKYNCTINDYLIACISNSLFEKAYDKKGPVRAILPLNYRDEVNNYDVGNTFALMLTDLCINEPSIDKRIINISQEVSKNKKLLMSNPYVIKSMDTILGKLSNKMQKYLYKNISSMGSLVISNLKGPVDKISFFDFEIDDLYGVVPASGDIALGVFVVSYAGDLYVNLNYSEGLFDDVEALREKIVGNITGSFI